MTMTFRTLITIVLALFAFPCIEIGAISANVQSSAAFPAESMVKRMERLNELGKNEGQTVSYNTRDLNGKSAPQVEVETNNMEEWLYKSLVNTELTYEKKDGNHYLIVRDKDSLKGDNHEVQQLSVITGQVMDIQKEPLIGVNIVEKGTSNGTVTDYDGNFSLNVGRDAILIVSYIGYLTQEVSTLGASSLHIILEEDMQSLDELVVIGYGTQKRANLTGAVGQMNASEIATRTSSDITGALQGLIPGLNIQIGSGDPTVDPSINIRGFNSINGGEPLVLVDGIEGDISRVNPNDIENITVLKDAASAAIYGARGSFGVVLITTKRGKSGEIVIDYSNNFAWTTPSVRTDFVSDPYVYGKAVDAALYGYNGGSYTTYNDNDWETIRKVAKGEIEPFHEKQADGSYKFFHNTNWYDYLFKKWQDSQYHNIAISGGSDKLKSYVSGRFYDRSNIDNIANSGMTRYNIKSNLVFNPYSWLEISHNIQVSHEKNLEYGGHRGGFGELWGEHTWRDLMPFYPNFVDGIPTDVGRGGSGGKGQAAAREAGENWRRTNISETTNIFRAKITPIEGLELDMDYAYKVENTSRTYRYNEFELLSTDRLILETIGINRLGEWRWEDKYNALNLFATYTKQFAEAHNFKILLGYNQEEFDRDRIEAQSNDLLVRELANLSMGTEMHNIDGSTLNWAIQGYFGRFNYDYKGRYLVEVNARRDGSSRFPSDSRWGTFPSISAGWQMSREKFWKPIENFIPSMKLRVSYGKLGNQSVGVNTFRELMNVRKTSWLEDGQKVIAAGSPSPLPRNISWESTKSFDVGIDLGLIQNTLLASFDWYQKTTEDMYLPGEPLPGVFGASEPRENYASLRNRGFELSLTYRNSFDVAGSPLSLRATASLSNFTGVITKFNNPQGLMSTYWEGQKLGQIWGYLTDGQFQSDEEALAYQNSFENPSQDIGDRVYRFILRSVSNSEWNHLRAGDVKYLDTNGDGKIDRGQYTLDDHGDLVPIGNAMPKFPFGFNLSATWKSFDLAVAGAGVGKQHWYPTGDLYWGTYERPYHSFLRKDLLENAWTEDSPGKYPQIYRGYTSLGTGRSLYEMNDYYLTNIGYLKVKNLTIGYTLPEELTSKILIPRFRIYVCVDNPLTIRFGGLTKYIDPEQAGSAINYSDPGDAVARANIRSYPMGKTFSFGFNMTL